MPDSHTSQIAALKQSIASLIASFEEQQRLSGLDTGDHNVVNVTYQGATIRIPSPAAVQQHRAALRRKLEQEAQQRWGGMGLYIREEGSRLPIEASPYQPGLSGLREDLLQRLQRAERLIVLGEPGSGKTVALQRFAWELCGDGQLSVPVLVPLLFYAGTPLKDWIPAILQETGQLRFDNHEALVAFLKEGKTPCCFLFDGLNEVTPTQRERLRDELVRWMAAYPEHAIIITSRVQDEQWRVLRQRVGDTLVIQPITDPQINAYLKAGLGEEQGQALFDRLAERLRTLAQRPLLLWLMKEAALANESLPGNRGELYARFVSRLLSRDTGERGIETRLPDRVKRQAAMRLAYELNARSTLVCARVEAAAIIDTQADKRATGDEVISVLLRHGVLSGDEQLRFPHQTLQEYFAAEALREVAGRDRKLTGLQRMGRNVWTALTGQRAGLAALAADDWWSETIIQLAGLIDDPAWLACTVAEVNPWLAWSCVEEGRTVDAETRATIESRSIMLLKSERVTDRVRAVQALSRIQSGRVADPLFQAASDSNVEVSEVAVQALLRLGETVKQRAQALAQQADAPWHRAGLNYLSALLGQPVVYVPPGLFLMGTNPAIDKFAFENESPQHEVTLAGYFIGRYLVTVAQFRAFVTASSYQLNDQYSLKGKDTNPVVNVTWDDALAYCRWLSERSGLRVTLPTEAEWEKAARGTDGRICPWGNDPPDDTRCNFKSSGRATTPVGQYSPHGDSPYGCADMAGNVWEWTRSLYREYPYDPQDGREDLQSRDFRVLRGGAFYNNERYVRCAYRSGNSPYYRYDYIGFRLVVSPL